MTLCKRKIANTFMWEGALRNVTLAETSCYNKISTSQQILFLIHCGIGIVIHQCVGLSMQFIRATEDRRSTVVCEERDDLHLV
jgi:hypothetical protein